MDKTIDSRFEGLEQALAKLVTSIATYNPQPKLAVDLVAADASLSEGLEQLSTHQANYLRILDLRSASSALDVQIRETLTVLTETRRALIDTPSTTFPEATNPVSYSELLSYARRISKFTLPPSYREPEAAATEAVDGVLSQETTTEPKSEPQTNGNTPLPVPNGTADTQMTGTDAAAESQPTQNTTDLPPDLSRFMNASAEIPFFPWPTEGAVRGGALAALQKIVERGLDPVDVDPEKEAIAEVERLKKEAEEEEEKGREEVRIREAQAEREKARREEHARRVAARQEQPGGQGQVPGRKAGFTLDTFDDDDDE